jgi:energy-coupling factor transport system permease protein
MNSGFKGCHPAVNMLFFISVLVYGMLFSHPVCLLISLLSSLTYYIKLQGSKAAHSFLCFLLPMLVIVTLINGLFSHYGITELFTLPDGNKVTFESVILGLVTGITVVSVILWFYCYNEVVTSDKFMYVFGKHIPAASLVISMALRFVPMYREHLREISDAQKGIGQDYKGSGIVNRIRRGGHVTVILITWALGNAIETSDSMRSRGYGLKGRRTYSRFHWTVSDTVLTVLMLLLDAVLAVGDRTGALRCFYNPQIIVNPSASFGITYFINELNITFNPFTVFGIFCIASYAALCFIPLIIDFKEDIKWNSLKSKI